YNIKLVAVSGTNEGNPANASLTTPDADGLVVAGCDNKIIYGLNARNGSVIWTYVTDGQVIASPTIQDSVVYIGSTDGRLYALNAKDGSLKWKSFTMLSGVFITAPVTYDKGTLYFGDYGGWLYSLDAATGGLKTYFYLPSP